MDMTYGKNCGGLDLWGLDAVNISVLYITLSDPIAILSVLAASGICEGGNWRTFHLCWCIREAVKEKGVILCSWVMAFRYMLIGSYWLMLNK